MKKINLTGKLALNKETITRLNNKQMGTIYGGSNADTMCSQSEDGGCGDQSYVAACNDTDAAAGCGGPSVDGACQGPTVNGYTCCSGSWNHSTCGGSPCNSGTVNTLERCCL